MSLCLSKHHMKTCGGVEVQIHALFTSTQHGRKWSISRPGRLPSETTRYPCNRKEPAVSSLIAHFTVYTYTNWATPDHTLSNRLPANWSITITLNHIQRTRTTSRNAPDISHTWIRTEMATKYGESLWAGRSGDRIPVGARFFTPVQTGPGAHPASYTMGPGGKAAGAWRWPLTPI
jgi:hypothetical protein